MYKSERLLKNIKVGEILMGKKTKVKAIRSNVKNCELVRMKK